MAQKKLPSVEDAINMFKDAMRRASLSDYRYVNKIMLSKNDKGVSVLIVPEQTLWDKILEDEELKSHIKELDISDKDENMLFEKFMYGEDVDSDSWISIDPQLMYEGKMFKVAVKGFTYEISINKGVFPIKLKKAEYNNFSYRLFLQPKLVLCVKKKFEGPVEDTSFTMIRMFQVI